MSILVRLSEEAIQYVMGAGQLRQVTCEEEGMDHRAGGEGEPGSEGEWDIQGMAGEMAVAIWLKSRGWLKPGWRPTVNTFLREPDVDPYQVRLARHRAGPLIIRPGDGKRAPGDTLSDLYIATSGTIPDIFINGWLYAGEASDLDQFPIVQGRAWVDYNNRGAYCWSVAQWSLRPMDTLPPPNEVEFFRDHRKRWLWKDVVRMEEEAGWERWDSTEKHLERGVPPRQVRAVPDEWAPEDLMETGERDHAEDQG